MSEDLETLRAEVGPGGLTIRASGTTANRYELVVDITALIS